MIHTHRTSLRAMYDRTRAEWGGVTVNPQTLEMVLADAEAYAVTVKPAGLTTLRIPADAPLRDFVAAWRDAQSIFAGMSDYIGVFHDAELGTIDFDPTVVVATKAEVDSLNRVHPIVGGAYEFHTGNGYYPSGR